MKNTRKEPRISTLRNITKSKGKFKKNNRSIESSFQDSFCDGFDSNQNQNNSPQIESIADETDGDTDNDKYRKVQPGAKRKNSDSRTVMIKTRSATNCASLSSSFTITQPAKKQAKSSQVLKSNGRQPKLVDTFPLYSKTSHSSEYPVFQRENTVSSTTKSPSDSEEAIDPQSISWVVKYEPKTSDTVALHGAKLTEVRDAINDIVSPQSSTRVLILSGPAGSSKSTVLKKVFSETISNRFGIRREDADFIEWETSEASAGKSLVRDFQDFLIGAKYRGSNQTSLIIVEDLPNLSHLPTKESFNSAILEWIFQHVDNNGRRPPCLALVITEVEVSDSDTFSRGALSSYINPASLITERIIFPKILTNDAVKRIKFNKVAKTICAKTLQRIADSEINIRNKIPKAEIANAINTLSTYGDIRASINTLEYWIRSKSTYSSTNSDDRKRRTKILLDLMKRDTHLDLFHAVGKVIHGSMRDRNGNTVQDGEIVIQDLMDDWGAGSRGDQQTLENLLFENYLPINKNQMTLDTALECLEALEIGNILTTKTNHPGNVNVTTTELAAQVEVRGLRTAISTQKAKATQTHGSKHYSRQTQSKSFFSMQVPQYLKRKKDADIIQMEQKLQQHQIETTMNSGTTLDLDTLILYESYYRDIIKNSGRYRFANQTTFSQESIQEEHKGIILDLESDTDTSSDDESFESDSDFEMTPLYKVNKNKTSRPDSSSNLEKNDDSYIQMTVVPESALATQIIPLTSGPKIELSNESNTLVTESKTKPLIKISSAIDKMEEISKSVNNETTDDDDEDIDEEVEEELFKYMARSQIPSSQLISQSSNT